MANRKIKADLEIDGKDNTSAAFRSVATRMGQVEKRIAAFNRTAKDFGRTAQEVNRRMSTIDKASQSIGQRQKAFAKVTRETFATVARYAAPAAIALGAKRALTDFAAVNREMNRIGITAEASGAETDAAFTKLQEMSKKTALPIESTITALDTLVSSGMNLKDAMDFLPSVLATAQASGATTEDIANTALKASSALQIQSGDMQHAFDIMVAGGKAGQFELKDMAMYIPDLANSFASLGYKGEDGLKRLVAILQTVREDTGNASDAAVYVQNILGKMNSQETTKNFKKMGVDLKAEMTKAMKAGIDPITAFVDAANKAVKGDLSKLPLLFNDQQMRLGMQSLMTSADSMKRFLDAVNSGKVDGTVWRDLKRVTGDTQASVDRLQGSWDKLWNSLGKSVSRPAVPVMDAITNDLDYGTSLRNGLAEQGMTYWQSENWIATHLPLGPLSHSDAADDIAFNAGYGDEKWRQNYQERRYERNVNKQSVGRQSMPIVNPEFPGGDRHLDPFKMPDYGIPMPTPRPDYKPPNPLQNAVDSARGVERRNVHYWQDAQYHEAQKATQEAMRRRNEDYTPTAERTTPQHVSELAGILDHLDEAEASSKANYRPDSPDSGAPAKPPEGSVWSRMDKTISNFFRVPSREEFHNAMKINVPEMGRSGAKEDFRNAMKGGGPDRLGSASSSTVGEHPSKDELPIKVDTGDLKQTADDASKSVTEAGRQAGDLLKTGGENAGAAILAAARALIDAATQLSNVTIKVPNAGAVSGASKPQANADVGRSNTFAAAPPGGTGGGGGF